MVGDRRNRFRRPIARPRSPERGRMRFRDRIRLRAPDRTRPRITDRLGPRPAKRLKREVGRNTPRRQSRDRHGAGDSNPPPKSDDEPSAKVFVGDIPEDVKKEDLEKEFSKFGDLKEVWIAQHPPNIAFIDYYHHSDAKRAVEALNGQNVCGAKVRVELSKKRENKPAGQKKKKKRRKGKGVTTDNGHDERKSDRDKRSSDRDDRPKTKSPSSKADDVREKRSERPARPDRGPPRPLSRVVPKSSAAKARAAKALKRARARVTGVDRSRPLAARLSTRRRPSPGRRTGGSPLASRSRRAGSPQEFKRRGAGTLPVRSRIRRGRSDRRRPISPLPRRRSPVRQLSPLPLRHTFSQSQPAPRSSRYESFSRDSHRDRYRDIDIAPSIRDREPVGRYSGGSVNGLSSWERSRGRPPSPAQYRSRSPPRHRYPHG